MAIQYNQITREGIVNAFLTQVALFGNSTTMTLRLYPTTVAYPDAPSATAVSAPSTHILQFTNVIFQRTGATLSFTAGSTTAAATTAAGTFSWWSLQESSTYGYIVSNSIGLSGSGSILTVSTMTPGSGTTVNISFNLSMV